MKETQYIGKFFSMIMACMLILQAGTFFYITMDLSKSSTKSELIIWTSDVEIEENKMNSSMLTAEEELIHDMMRNIDIKKHPSIEAYLALASHQLLCQFEGRVISPPPEALV